MLYRHVLNVDFDFVLITVQEILKEKNIRFRLKLRIMLRDMRPIFDQTFVT